MRKITRLEQGECDPGSSVPVVERVVPTSIWRKAGYTEDHSFTWEARIPGAVAGHVVEPDDEGSKVTLTASVTGGLLATSLSPLIGMIWCRNVRLEVEGLRRHCEGFVDS
jgi:hypothetical protein